MLGVKLMRIVTWTSGNSNRGRENVGTCTSAENGSGEPSSSRGQMPTLPEGVRACEGIPRESWSTRVVILTNEAGEDVTRAICRSVDASVVVDTNGRPIGDDHVAVQIAETLKEEEVPLGWMWSMHSWPIGRVFLNGASLYDHDQTDMNTIFIKMRVFQ